MSRGAWDVKGFEQDLRRSTRAMKQKLTLARRVGHSPELMRELRVIVADNNAVVFASSSVQSELGWGERDFVESGKFRQQLSTPGAMLSTVSASGITFRPQVKYWRFLRPAYAWLPISVERMARALSDILARDRPS